MWKDSLIVKGRVNEGEGAAIVKEIKKRRYKDTQLKNQSIGVVYL